MSDEPGNLENNDGNDVDLGAPIGMLAGLEAETSSGLLIRIREAIDRRKTLAQLTIFSTQTPWVVLRELWLAVHEHLALLDTRKDDDGKTKAP
jgi:hypothetical protein